MLQPRHEFPPTAQAAGWMLESPENSNYQGDRMPAFRKIFCLVPGAPSRCRRAPPAAPPSPASRSTSSCSR